MYPVSRSFFFSIPACAESFDRVSDIHVDSLFTLGETANKPTMQISATLMVKKEKKSEKKTMEGKKAVLPHESNIVYYR